MKRLFLFLFLITGHVAFTQTYSVRGKVAEEQGDALPFASVSLLQPGDSSVVRHTTTNSQGKFILNDIEKGEYIFKVSFLGFAPWFRNLKIPAETDPLNLGTIELRPVTIELAAVTVSGTRASVLVKEDTVEYNAGSFSTLPNGSVGQLLKKLPGIFVERDGRISAQGENVVRIYVDGKEYFGNNMKAALRNLPADAIDRVQLIDERSEGARFSGIDDGRRRKVINVTLKENWRDAGFGRAMAGVGTAERYAAEANYNYLAEGNMVSVTGASNNINNHDLSGESGATGAGGGRSAGRGGNNGLVDTHSGGINVFNQVGSKTTVNANYMLDYTNASIKNNLSRQNFMPGGTAMYYENSLQQNKNRMQIANAGLEHRDSVNTVRLNTSISFMEAGTISSSTRQSYTVDGVLANEGERSANVQNDNFNLNTELFYGHRFRKSGRLVTVKSYFNVNQDDARGRSDAFTRFREGEEELERQQNEQENKSLNYSVQLTYTEPIAEKQYLQAHYQISNQSSNSRLEVYDIINEVRLFNEEQSSRFSSGFLYQQLGLSYRLSRKRYNLGLGANMQQSVLSRSLALAGERLTQNFQNLLPYLNFNTRIKKSTRLNFDYITSVKEPTINQLQPVLSRFDPLNLYIGNPGLRPEYTHQAKLRFNTSGIGPGIFVSGSVQFSYTANPITPAVSISERQVRTTQYVNVQDSRSSAIHLNAGLPLKKYNSQLSLGPYLRRLQSSNLLNGVEGSIDQQTIGGKFGYSFSFKELIDFNLHSILSVTRSDYELNENRDQLIMTSAYMADATVHFLEKYYFRPEFDYSRYRNARTDFDQAFPIFNFSFARYFLKNNRGELKLSAVNVLNRNAGATQVATLNFIEQSTQNALGNYYMLSFTYNLQQSN